MSGAKLNLLGFVGSLRGGSYNRLLMNAFVKELPDHVTYVEADFRGLPVFDADAFNANGLPEVAERLVEQTRAADAIVFATPEYNYSVPGGLKNAIDWISRARPGPFVGKPVAMMSASTSLLGGARAQYHLRQILVFLDAYPVNKPEVFLSTAPSKFDQDGNLTDSVAAGLLKDLGRSLIDFHSQLFAGTENGVANQSA